MPALRIDSFSGIVPRTGPTQLQGNQAQIATDVKLYSGELRPWQAKTEVHTPAVTNTQSMYKFTGPTGTTPIWLEWAADVDVVPGPVADTSEYRLYYTSASFGPKKTNWLLASGSGVGSPPYPNAYYEMGVPTPATAPTAVAAGTGTAPVETRAYVYTYVTEFGTVAEESAPSPAVTVTTNYSGDSVTISGFAAPPAGNYNFQYKRIYRSVIGATASSYQLVAEIPIATSSYVDTKAVADLGVIMTSSFYTPPPSALQGLIAMPNGMLVGFTGNQIWFCEPYLPHAWPETYMLTTEYPIVGLGVFGNTLFVGTTKNPYLITGTTPSAMSQEKLPMIQPCVSKKSITSDQFGVLYASPNGLVSIAPGTMDVISNALYTRDEWALLTPSSMIGAVYNNMYFGFYNNGSYGAIVLKRGDIPPLVSFTADAKAVFVEPTTGVVNILSAADNKVYSLDSSASTTTFTWKSKKFLHARPTNYAAMQLHADYDYIASHAGTYVNVKAYADGVKVFDYNITNDTPVRMAAGTKAYNWEIALTGTAPVRSVIMATSIAEIAGV